ncbi:MAG: PAS domain S-box protein [Deltaproteobacteria bacterium]
MKQLQGIHKWILPFLIVITLPIWFYCYPLGISQSLGALILDGAYICLFLVAYVLILNSHITAIEILWTVLAYILFLSFIDDLTAEPRLKNTLEVILNWNLSYIDSILQILGILILIICFYLYRIKLNLENIRTKQIEKKSRENEERYNLISYNSTDLILILSPEGIILYASASHLEALGFTPLDLSNKNIADLVHPDDKNLFHEALSNHQAAEGASVIPFEMRIKTSDEYWIPLEAKLSAQTLAPGAGSQIILSARNVTQSKSAEKSLILGRSEYSNLFLSAPVGIYSMNAEGKILRANPALVQMLGYSSFIEMVLVSLERRTFDDAYSWNQFKERFLSNGAAKSYESRWKRRDGSIIFIRETIRAKKDESGAVLEYEGFAEDVTGKKLTAEALAEAEKRQSVFIEHSQDLMLETDLNGAISYASSNHRQALGYEPGELAGRSVYELIHEDDGANLRAELSRSAISRSVGKVELRYKTHDSSRGWVWAECVCRVFTTTRGDMRGFIVSRDITHRKKSDKQSRYDTMVKSIANILHNLTSQEDALELIADRIKNNLDNADNVSVWRVRGEEAALQLHRGLPEWFAERMKRVESPKGFIWRTITEGKTVQSADADRDILISPEGRELGTKSYASAPIKFLGKVTKVINVNSYRKNAFGADELRVLETVAELIEGRLIKETVKESEERYLAIAESASNLICELNANGDYTYVSAAYKQVLDYEPAELIGENILEMVHLDDFPTLIWEIKNGFEANSGRIAFRYKHRNGHWRWFENRARKFRTADGEVHFLVVSEDITERKRMEKEVIKVQKLESLGILAGGIAHDFNNLLTAIWGNVSLVKMGTTGNEKLQKRLADAEKACIRARDLTEQLLTFSKGGMPVKKTTSLGELITESASFAIRGSNVKCEFLLDEALWPSEVDEGQISQVINNLAINADQAMPEGGVITIKAENANIDEQDRLPVKEGRYIKISVQDQGIGIPEEYLPKIFDPYFTTKQKGSGLGLATVNSVIKNHDGYIRVDSKLKFGTKFYVYLPASEREISKHKPSEKEPVWGNGKILVMDDEDIVRETVSAILANLGYEVVPAADGNEAIEIYKRAKASDRAFDLVIMDLTVPGGMGGRETMRRLLEFDPEIKAIVSSGYQGDTVMADHKGFGFKGVVGKPYKIQELSKTVYEVICDTGA